jgi:hypothetical protein
MRACVTGAWMTYLLGALQVPLSSSNTGAIVPAAAGSSSLDGGGVEPLSKKACPWSFLPKSTRYMCGAEFRGMSFLLPAFQISCFEGSIGLNDKSRTMLVSVVHHQPVVSMALATEVLGAGGAPWASLEPRCLVPACPGVQPWVVPASLDRIFPVLPTLCLDPSIRGGWRLKQS